VTTDSRNETFINFNMFYKLNYWKIKIKFLKYFLTVLTP